jgi:glucose-6-phosphate 1-dehydrogenase
MMHQAFVVFGSTGNLMYKKLIPAFDSLLKQEKLNEEFHIYAVGRRDYTTEDYFNVAQKEVQSTIDWNRMHKHISYVKLDVNSTEDYRTLKKQLEEDGVKDVMAYLAVPPSLFPVIAQQLSTSGIIQKGSQDRVVFEKPFGEDLQTAKDINLELWNYFEESQIYRIDHYLGKDMIQNILVVRFGNRIFEQTWNANTIRSVVVVAKEEESVMQRGGYYDSIGAIKDMLQSHLLQMASLVAMTKPNTFESEDIKEAKIQVFKHLKINLDSVVRGQYNGYKNAPKVDQESSTETFVFCEARIDLPKWTGVPFYFITGKHLDEKRSEIIINFKDDDSLLALHKDAKPNQNRLVIKVSPEDGVEFYFNVKQPGLDNAITSASLDYCHSCLSLQNTPEAYEKLLLDFTKEVRTLFTRWDEIEATWHIVERLKQACQSLYYYDNYDDIKQQIRSHKGVDLDDL